VGACGQASVSPSTPGFRDHLHAPVIATDRAGYQKIGRIVGPGTALAVLAAGWRRSV